MHFGVQIIEEGAMLIAYQYITVQKIIFINVSKIHFLG